MRNFFIILLLIFTIGCRNNTKQPIKIGDSSSDTSKIAMKKIYSNFHQFDTIPFSRYFKDPNLNPSVLSYCRGKFQITVDDRTVEFLDMLSQKNDKYFQLYYSVFNNILSNSDGAVGELMGPYCFKFVINYPNEVLKDFISDKRHLHLYSMSLGAEFFFKTEGTSDLKYNFEDFKKYLVEKLDSNNFEIKKITDLFFTMIDSTIFEMDLPERQINQ
jgi:hypothetical protein